MTTQEIIEQVFAESGARSDMIPYTDPSDETTFDITLAGAQKVLRYVNQAVVRIANWQFPTGRSLRFKNLIERIYFKTNAPIERTATAGSTNTITIPGLATNTADQFRGWVVEIVAGTGSGQRALILSNTVVGTNCVCTVATEWGTVPDNTSEVELYKNFWEFAGDSAAAIAAYHIALDEHTEMMDVMRVRDVTTMTDLTPTERTDIFTAGILVPGTPSMYRVMSGAIYLDTPVNEDRAYEILYLRQPNVLVAATDVPELPVQFHEAIALWATHSIQRMNNDYDGAYATKRELLDLLGSIRLPGYNDMELEDGGITMYS